MNPLCPRCHAELESWLCSDDLECPSCEYSWGRLNIDVSKSLQESTKEWSVGYD